MKFHRKIFLLLALGSSLFALADDYEALLDSADNYIKRSRWNEAAGCIRRSLRLKPASPLNAKLFSNLGVCLAQAGDIPGALEAFDLALVREPDSPSILYSRASTYVLSGKYPEALADLDHALAGDSLRQDALRLRGQLLLASTKPEDTFKAERDFTTLQRHYPADPWGPAGLGGCHINREEFGQAAPLFAKAISLGSKEEFHISYITALLAIGSFSEAEEAIYQALELFPRSGELYLRRALLHKKTFRNSDMEIDKKFAREYGVDPQTIELFLR